VERSKSRSLVDLLASRKEFSVQGENSDAVQQALANLTGMEIESHSLGAGNAPQERAGTRNIAVVQERIQQLAPELSSLVTVSSVSLRRSET